MQDIISHHLIKYMFMCDYYPILLTCKYFKNISDKFIDYHISLGVTCADFCLLDDIVIVKKLRDKYGDDIMMHLHCPIKYILLIPLKSSSASYSAILSNNMYMYIMDIDKVDSSYIFRMMLIHDRIECILYIYDANRLNSISVHTIIQYNSNKIFDFYYSIQTHTYRTDRDLIRCAIVYDNVYVVKKIIQYVTEFKIRNNNILSVAMLQVLHQYTKIHMKNLSLNIDVFRYAYEYGIIDMTDMQPRLYNYIIDHGDIELLQFIYNYNFTCVDMPVLIDITWDLTYIKLIISYCSNVKFTVSNYTDSTLDNIAWINSIDNFIISDNVRVFMLLYKCEFDKLSDYNLSQSKLRKLYEYFVSNCYIPAIEYLHTVCNVTTIEIWLTKKHIPMIKWFIDNHPDDITYIHEYYMLGVDALKFLYKYDIHRYNDIHTDLSNYVKNADRYEIAYFLHTHK